MATNKLGIATDLFAPRKALTAHLQALVEQGVIRGVGQAHDFADVMDGVIPPNHGFVYVTYDKSSNISTQGKSSIKSIETYTLLLAWRNNRSERSHHSHGMDDAGQVKSAIEFFVHGWTIGNDSQSSEFKSLSMGSPFVLSATSPEAFYRSGGWAYYPISFDITVIRTRPMRASV